MSILGVTVLTKLFTSQLMLLAMISGALVFCRLAAQYVHPKPTVYDRLLEGFQKYREKNKVTEEVDMSITVTDNKGIRDGGK